MDGVVGATVVGGGGGDDETEETEETQLSDSDDDDDQFFYVRRAGESATHASTGCVGHSARAAVVAGSSMASASKVIVLVSGGREELLAAAERFAWELQALPNMASDGILGVAIVPWTIVAELQRRCTVNPHTGVLVEIDTRAERVSLQPRGIGSHWHVCDPDHSNPNGCPLGLGRDFAGSSKCAFAGRRGALAAFVDVEVYGFDPTELPGSPMTTWRASLPLGGQTAAFCIERLVEWESRGEQERLVEWQPRGGHVLMVVEAVKLLDYHFHGVDVNFVRGQVEPSDESPAHAAAREVGEETGVSVDAASLEPLGELFSQTVYTRQNDGTEAGRPQRKKTQAFVLDCAAAENATIGFLARNDCRRNVVDDEVAERARIADEAERARIGKGGRGGRGGKGKGGKGRGGRGKGGRGGKGGKGGRGGKGAAGP
ncbi:hypothetical protein M885DRAFT_524621 [Pelagophyceae sp. CCMP2097]|nr:hypothetical protein M885DRAFT_524621 [Pelagophyceae sp. CCMP2097]